ncbi:hypothetical protein [Brevibacillus formosus]|uniref:hypothetical protein n=1 Tax=Brevibacillus formosus TaxID=54913 RepID=UPI001476F628|nr:hypothetical protein [Brevibacillus formosus]MED1960382.1 hypothetical protein [Brevibacillus formosus]
MQKTGQVLFLVKNVSTFFIKVYATACGQQNGFGRFVVSAFTQKPRYIAISN